MDNSKKKYKVSDSFNPKVEEPSDVYENNQSRLEIDSETEWEVLPNILKKLLEKGIKESEQGLGISHEEMMKRVKAKYPFINGI